MPFDKILFFPISPISTFSVGTILGLIRCVSLIAIAHSIPHTIPGSLTFPAYENRLLKNGKAVGYIGKARAPTVTMPRLKALTAGSPPVFLDLVLNIEADNNALFTDSSFFSTNQAKNLGFSQETWLRQLVNANHTLVFYGDDTWLRLFPECWYRYEGTHSFFVTDTVHVDLNVTRNVPKEMQKSDWHTMVLHYLGLDHIGHTEGAFSQKMPAKQREMDQVVQEIYQGLEKKDQEEGRRSLMVILGDHGMTDAGNHGGASPGETDTALVFASPHFPPISNPTQDVRTTNNVKIEEIIEQVDVVPTLSCLLGVKIPKDSTGKLVKSILQKSLSPDQAAKLLPEWMQMNIEQLETLLGKTNIATSDKMRHQLSLSELDIKLNRLVEKVAKRVGSYDLYRMSSGLVIGVLVAGCICLFGIFNRNQLDGNNRVLKRFETINLWVCMLIIVSTGILGRFIYDKLSALVNGTIVFGNDDDELTLLSVVGVIGLCGSLIIALVRLIKQVAASFPSISREQLLSFVYFVGGILVYGGLLQSSSFIEEEHQIWYFFFPTLLILCSISTQHFDSVQGKDSWKHVKTCGRLLIALMLFRLLRGWNSVGFQGQETPDLRLFLQVHPKINLLATASGMLLLWTSWLGHYRNWCQVRSRLPMDLVFTTLLYLVWRYKCNEIKRYASIHNNMIQISTLSGEDANALVNFVARMIYGLIGYLVVGICSIRLVREQAWSATMRLIITALIMFLQKSHNAIPILGITVLSILVNKLTTHKHLEENGHLADETRLGWVLNLATRIAFIHSSYFLLGPSNLIASIDFTNAYAGLDSFHMIPVMVGSFIIAWSGPILALFSFCPSSPTMHNNDKINTARNDSVSDYDSDMAKESRQGPACREKKSIPKSVKLVLGWRSVVHVAIMICLWIQRDHISIWTVYAPRLLFEYGWIVYYNVILLPYIWYSYN